jgi:hypothetical protein
LTAPYYQNPPAQPGGSAIAVTTKFIPLAFILYFFKPKVVLNGHELPQQGWGRQVIPVQPGQYHLEVYTPYFLPPKVGQSAVDVPVAPGQTVELEYKVPAVVFMKGSLGAPPQKYNGLWVLWVMLGVVGLFIVCCCLSAVLSNGNS